MEMVSASAVSQRAKSHQPEIELGTKVSNWASATGSEIDRVDPSVSLFEMERIFDGPEPHPGVICPLAGDTCNDNPRIDQSGCPDRESKRGMKVLIEAANVIRLGREIRDPSK
jgi:hypothetical protein